MERGGLGLERRRGGGAGPRGLRVEEDSLHALSAGGGMIRRATSEVVALQEVGSLQHLDVALVDLERRAEADGETGQHVAALHEEERLPVDLLVGGAGRHHLEEDS